MSGRENLLTCRLAEHLVCAELARHKLIATTFTHNVPVYDIIATDANCCAVPIQVKASRQNMWRSIATKWMKIRFSKKDRTQHIDGLLTLNEWGPVWICVAVKEHSSDEFFILSERDLQKVVHTNYLRILGRHNGRRPRRWKSVDCWWTIQDIADFRDNWDIINDRVRQL